MRLFITFQSGVPSSSPTHFPTDGSDTATAMKANKESLPGFTAEGKKALVEEITEKETGVRFKASRSQSITSIPLTT